MKKLLIVLVLVFLSCSGAFQIAPQEARQLQKVRDIAKSKDEIYNSALEWFATTFVSSKEVIELQDKENGKIVGKGITSVTVYPTIQWDIRFTFVMDIKENKYRITFSDFYLTDGGRFLSGTNEVEKTKAKLVLLENNLNTTILQEKEDW